MPLPEGITNLDVSNPSNNANLTCVSFLEKMYPLVKARMDKAIAGGMPPDAKDTKSYQDMKTRSMQLQNGIE